MSRRPLAWPPCRYWAGSISCAVGPGTAPVARQQAGAAPVPAAAVARQPGDQCRNVITLAVKPARAVLVGGRHAPRQDVVGDHSQRALQPQQDHECRATK